MALKTLSRDPRDFCLYKSGYSHVKLTMEWQDGRESTGYLPSPIATTPPTSPQRAPGSVASSSPELAGFSTGRSSLPSVRRRLWPLLGIPSDLTMQSLPEATKRLGQSAPTIQTSTAFPNAAGGYTTKEQYGQSPFSERTFNKLWKSLKRVSFDLQPGGTRKFLYKIHVNKTFSRAEQEQYLTQGTSFVANQTIIPMIITRPGMATVQDAAGDPTEVTIAQASVATIITNHFTWTSLGAARLEYDRTFQGIVQGTPTGHATKKENIVIDVDTVAAVLNL